MSLSPGLKCDRLFLTKERKRDTAITATISRLAEKPYKQCCLNASSVDSSGKFGINYAIIGVLYTADCR
ncbi:hypothetical protein [Nostoc sp. T09]|uniref:hypothetical protein n=1 Tax=Nostoc sp. T09 TaxID=1932621 RepID=UPI00117CC4B8|nr:hypothetical protein [Nostoc sp. T09]